MKYENLKKNCGPSDYHTGIQFLLHCVLFLLHKFAQYIRTVGYCAGLVETNSWAVWAEQYALLDFCLDQPAWKEIYQS